MTKIKQYLIQKEMTLNELSNETGLSIRLIDRYIRDYYDLKLKDAKKIADALNIKLEDLL